MVKHMNKVKPSENRIVLTTIALNHSMPVQRSVGALRLKHSQQNRKYVSGTQEDVKKLRLHISKVLGMPEIVKPSKVKFNKSTWGDANSAGFLMEVPVSDRVEEAFGNVCDWVHKNKKMLVNSDGNLWEEVDIVDIDDIEEAQAQQQNQPYGSTQ